MPSSHGHVVSVAEPSQASRMSSSTIGEKARGYGGAHPLRSGDERDSREHRPDPCLLLNVGKKLMPDA